MGGQTLYRVRFPCGSIRGFSFLGLEVSDGFGCFEEIVYVLSFRVVL